MSNDDPELLFCIGVRLREERERLEETQESIAKKLDITSKTWSKYELGKTNPTTMTLVMLGSFGFDVGYVLTGTKSPVAGLSPKENTLVENYRSATPEHQSTLDTVSAALAQPGVGKAAQG